MAKPPMTLGNDPILYHRLTGHRRWTLADMTAAARQGFALLSFDERQKIDEFATTTGLDPVDLAAGDGEGIFLSLGQPIDPSLWQGYRGDALRTPGVGFRLSTLLKLGPVTFRPGDLQRMYAEVLAAFDLHRWVDEAQDDEGEVSAWGELSSVLHFCREIGEAPATKDMLLGALLGDSLPPPKPSATSVRAAIRDIQNVSYDMREAYGDEDDEDDESGADIDDRYDGWIAEMVDDAAAAWRNPRNGEVVFWGGVLPLAEADVFFSADGDWYYRETALAGLGRNRWVPGG